MTVMSVPFQNLPLSSPKKMFSPVSLSGGAVWSCCRRLKKNPNNSEPFERIVHKKQETRRKEPAVMWSRCRGHILHILQQPSLCAADRVSPLLR